jgi:hypothetical protein
MYFFLPLADYKVVAEGLGTTFCFWSKVEAACGLETVITVITVIDCPPYIDHMDYSASSSTSEFSSEFFPAYLRSCAS